MVCENNVRASICAAHLWLCSLPWSDIPESQSLSFRTHISVETDTETFGVQITGGSTSIIIFDLLLNYMTWYQLVEWTAKSQLFISLDMTRSSCLSSEKKVKRHTVFVFPFITVSCFNQCNSHSYPSVLSYLDYPALSSIWPLHH